LDREASLNRLKKDNFDILVIGGGATGVGTALDAASRGLRVALVEARDFSSETSSRSTKLLHGGVRYLEQAVRNLDFQQYQLVRDALQERSVLLKIAPHLCHRLAILTPLYGLIDVPYYTAGLKMYDRISGKRSLGRSHFVGPKEALRKAPMLKGEGLKGAVVYYDAQFNDARMNVAIALTAAAQGAVVCNHVRVKEFQKSKDNITGVKVEDALSSDSFEVKAKVVINATGPFVDKLRQLDNPKARAMLSTSSGAHIVLSKKFSPENIGILIPETEDKRVLFLLPWLGHTLVGTTDVPREVLHHPKPLNEEIEYICRHCKNNFSIPLERKDVLAAWSGLRPLVAEDDGSETAHLSRDHVIKISTSGLITIAGGKWTTYRLMAMDTVDKAMDVGEFKVRKKSQTQRIPIMGGENYTEDSWQSLQKEFGLDIDVAKHLHHSYGDQAASVGEWVKKSYKKRLADQHPYVEAEVIYAAKEELARTVVDILARRTRLGFLDAKAAVGSIPRVTQILAEVFSWDKEEQKHQTDIANEYFALDPFRC